METRWTLAIEAAVGGGSVSLQNGERSQTLSLNAGERSSAETLLPVVSDLLNSVGITPPEISLIAVSAGPGSFTGIRIGLATALGLSTASGAEIRRCSLLKALAYSADSRSPVTVAIPMGRNAVAVQRFDKNGSDGEPRSIPISDFASLEGVLVVYSSLVQFCGSAADVVDMGKDLAKHLAEYAASSPSVDEEPIFISKTF